MTPAPAPSTVAAVARSVIERAIRAPSSHNTQPWRFRVGDGRLDVLIDRTRALPVNDPHDRELTISVAIAVFDARAGAARAGLRGDVEPFPKGQGSELVARIGLDEGGSDLDAFADAIWRRRTHRPARRRVDGATRAVRRLSLRRRGEHREEGTPNVRRSLPCSLSCAPAATRRVTGSPQARPWSACCSRQPRAASRRPISASPCSSTRCDRAPPARRGHRALAAAGGGASGRRRRRLAQPDRRMRSCRRCGP